MNRNRNLKLAALLLALLLAVAPMGALAEAANAVKTVKINKTNFPDSKFRAYVKATYDTDKNGKLSPAEIKAAEWLDVENMGVSSLKGVEYLVYLTHLDCQWNEKISGKLDLRKNTRLVYVNCDVNRLTGLNVSKCKKLQILRCGRNRLTKLDVSNCPALYYLYCSNNRLTKLDVRKNPKMYWLDCDSNRLTNLTLGRQKKLIELSCYFNKLKKLDIANCPNLKALMKSEDPQTPDEFDRVGWIDDTVEPYWIFHIDASTVVTAGKKVLYKR